MSNDFKLGQAWVTANTRDDLPDISVVGTDLGTMPTIEEAFKAQFIARFVERGVPEQVALAEYDAIDVHEYDDMTPAEVADELMSYWDAD